MQHKLPRRFGPYSVLQQVGAGGMGTIYRALDTRLEREVALKVLHRDLDVSAARERFLNEARVVSSLSHPNICAVFDIGEQDDDLYLVMEMLHGQSLKEHIAAGPLSPEQIHQVALQAARALGAAHARGIVHRDIKPANLFLLADPQGSAMLKVLDFGLAKWDEQARPKRNRSLTRHGSTVGTVEYMSPEQACGGAVDARSDLFSLGAVLYELATGQTPFTGATSAIIYAGLLNEEPAPAREANLDLPAYLNEVIHHLLQKSPERRPQTASELIQELGGRSAAAQHGRPGTRAAGRPAVPAGVRLRGRRISTDAASPLAEPSSQSAHEIVETAFATAVHRASAATVTRARHRKRQDAISLRRLAMRAALVSIMAMLFITGVGTANAVRKPTVFRGKVRICPVQNRTGDAALDTMPTELLREELTGSGAEKQPAQSASASSLGTEVASLHAPLTAEPTKQTCSAAEREAVVTGAILPATDGYALHLQLLVGTSGAPLAEAEELAPSLEQIPAAIRRAGAVLRESLGDQRGPTTPSSAT